MSVEHFTPIVVVEAARSLMSRIDLDPATTLKANAERIHARHYYTKTDNGLSRKWHGNVFLNPPGGRIDEKGKPVEHGGRSSSKVWWQKLVNEYQAGRVKQAIFIGFSIELLQSCQIGEHSLMPMDFPICIPSHRLAFDTYAGKKWVEGKQPTHANVIVYLPARTDSPDELFANTVRFAQTFSTIGAIMQPARFF
jgi:hypothetical protein